ncbi:M4 family metallopeptidase [Wenjunlia tyrosinilytica]|uniref:Neutral metalloproteinase n=1 Tax=Wenjunlia tyrosinilytica TaxID=1544741 RepID=A0A917ZCQ2_9ACTN|nr:M4 family metallopeptidase [Wenjunlia tyrosinilytica]GGO80706.1 metalloprotease [Wenjunlia tyrosinilytica]
MDANHVFCGIVPPHMLDHLARSGSAAVADAARNALRMDAFHRERRLSAVAGAPPQPTVPGAGTPPDAAQRCAESVLRRTIGDAEHHQRLPGRVVRAEGQDAVSDEPVNRAYDGLGHTHRLYLDAFERDSIDDSGLALNATVHYSRHYDNAFWDGEQMVFGDGDGEVFNDFTISLDVIGHELTHGVTQYTANLDYSGQSGALNESMSDVFGSLVKQYALGQGAAEADWLIGEGLLTDQVQGVALRSMKAPGTAYDDDVLGKDPQPATMDDYVETTDDNGGVHINSGIPNHAFYLAATALGGNAWERAGRIWYDVLTGGKLATDADFASFAGLTAAAARARYGEGEEVQAVLDAWKQVGVPTGSEEGSAVVRQRSGTTAPTPTI